AARTGESAPLRRAVVCGPHWRERSANRRRPRAMEVTDRRRPHRRLLASTARSPPAETLRRDPRALQARIITTLPPLFWDIGTLSQRARTLRRRVCSMSHEDQVI